MSALDHIAESIMADMDFDAGSIRDSFEPSELVYYSEADDVINRHESDYGDDAADICSGVEYAACDWLQAKMAYANALNYCAEHAELAEALETTESEISEFDDACQSIAGWDDSAKVEFSLECPHGWAVHNRETDDGCLIWSNEPRYYNPELLEGELLACSKKLSCGVWVSATCKPLEG